MLQQESLPLIEYFVFILRNRPNWFIGACLVLLCVTNHGRILVLLIAIIVTAAALLCGLVCPDTVGPGCEGNNNNEPRLPQT